MTDLKSLRLADWLARAEAVSPRSEAFIDGRFVAAASGRTFTDIGPRDGRQSAGAAASCARDLAGAVTAARTAFEDRRWSDQAPKNRKRVLLRLAELIRA